MDLLLPQIEFENGTWLDEPIEQDTNLRYWHIIFMGLGIFFSVGEFTVTKLKVAMQKIH